MGKTLKTVTSLLLALALTALCVAPALASDNFPPIRILFTSDLHDRILPYQTYDGTKPQSTGGYARLKTLVDRYRNDNPNTLVLDAGGSSAGTLFSGIFANQAPDLSLLGKIGYDAAALGEEEFTYGAAALTNALGNAENPPLLLCANVDFGKNAELKAAYEAVGGKAYEVFELTGNEAVTIKVGVFGLMGEKAAASIGDGVTFTDRIKAAQACVKALEDAGCDPIICLSHSGDGKLLFGEDITLAQKVKGIDVIISGNTTQPLNTVKEVKGTSILSCGPDGRYLGLLDYDVALHEVDAYRLVPLDKTVKKDKTVEKTVDAYRKTVQQDFLDPYGFDFDEQLTTSRFDFDRPADTEGLANHAIGDLVVDSYVAAAGDETALGFTFGGEICDVLREGDISLSQAYAVVPTGMGVDGSTGSSLVKAYLTGKDLRTLCEIDCSLGQYNRRLQVFGAGFSYEYDAYRPFLSRVSEVTVTTADGAREPVGNKTLYPFIFTTESYKTLQALAGKSGFVKITPRNSEGDPLTGAGQAVLRDETTGNETKAWVAFATFLKSWRSGIPTDYSGARILKTDTGFDFGTYFTNTSAVGALLYGLVVLVLVLLIVTAVLRRRRRRQKALRLAAEEEEAAEREQQRRLEEAENADLDATLDAFEEKELPPREKRPSEKRR